jgi:hypothetical protein
MNYSLLILACIKINLSHVFWSIRLMTNNIIHDPNYKKEKKTVFSCYRQYNKKK